MFEVYDTIGLCETSKGNVSNSKAPEIIKNYFAKVQSHSTLYVKKKGRFTMEDIITFAEFKRIFAGGQPNFVIIITKSNQKWVTRNLKTLRDYFGNSHIIAVDCPFSDDFDENLQNQTKRQKID
ncbi:hypothetical protein Glove_60g68 [Diversispora epigaea]|uniref:Uncharacterized protein n=1 Tax=Diversispora epigaea TaxID=1348612 RepID=A0A397JE07_9GLOM|nr:hypothetical protein Glove_60g68 [Diversispora epigaea]